MSAVEAHSVAVDEDSANGHLEDVTTQARGAELRRRRETAGMTLVDLAGETGLARQTIARAEDGQGSRATYRQLETWFNRFDEETGANAPGASAGLIEFEVTGDFGVRVVVRGPIGSAEELERSVARIVRNIRSSDDTPTSGTS